MRFIPLLLVVFLLPSVASAQSWGEIRGEIRDQATLETIPGVTVVVAGTNYGTASRDDGSFLMRIPAGRYLIRFSAVGYESVADSAIVFRDEATEQLVVLSPATVGLDEITIEGSRQAIAAGVFQLDAETIESIPAPMKDVLRSLKVIPGVATNNELSNQYSVRGGGFNENLLFVNGFEVYLPFRPRQGEQEGLSLLNPDLTESLTFYTGGFPVRYGGKLSSALDVQYTDPQPGTISGKAYSSLLDAGVAIKTASPNGRVSVVGGARRARARRFFATQELKGTYDPNFTDVQLGINVSITRSTQLELLGMYAEHEFTLDPNTRKTFFGTVSQDPRIAPSNLKSLWTTFDPDNFEIDGYQTSFAGARLVNTIDDRITVTHDVSIFDTSEEERFEISGTAVLFQVNPGSGDPDTGEGLLEAGTSSQEETADNRIDVRSTTANGAYRLNLGRTIPEVGWYARRLEFTDRINEKSVVTGPSTEGGTIRIVADSLIDSASFSEEQFGFYLHNDFDALASSPGRLLISGGLRGDYYSFSNEFTVSPRLSMRFQQSSVTSFFGSAGVYHQTPVYRELRGKPDPGETILGSLNRDLKSQRSLQFVAGLEHFFTEKRLTLRTEAYLKRVSNLISYDIDNVRVEYSGVNDAKGTMYGLDVQVRGELVPGLESWINYGYLHATESFLPGFQDEFTTGSNPRPTDQRHTVSIFIQDYIPNDPNWKIHMRTLFGSGLPYTPPVPGEQVGSLLTQIPGDRLSARYPVYFRFDIGASRDVTVFQNGFSGLPVVLELTGELLNVFDQVNTISYYWVPDSQGLWNRIPTRLTPRTINVRASVRF
ncbi:MAG: TonB-dependent receptor [Rhodothermales bacterium]|nr:TonB-dependent receptor [Rhodothermales bacterium]